MARSVISQPLIEQLQQRADQLGIEPNALLQRMLQHSQLLESTSDNHTALIHAVFEQSKEIVTLHTLDGGYLYSGASYNKLLGYTATELASMSRQELRMLVHPDDRARAEVAHDQVIKGQKATGLEYRLRRKDGSYIWLKSSSSPLVDEHGRPYQILSINRDISDQKSVQDQLREREARLTALLDSQSAFVIRTDIEGNYTYINQSFFAQHGIRQFASIEEMLGTSSMESVLPVDHALCLQTVERCLAEPGKPMQVVLRKPLEDAPFYYTLWEFTAITDESGVPQEIHCIGFDITQLKLIEQELMCYKHIVSCTTDGIALLSTDYHYQIVNETYLRRNNRRIENIVGKHVSEIFGDAVFTDIIRPHLERSLAGEVVQYADWFDFPTEGHRFIEVTYLPYRAGSDTVAGIIVNTRDVTDRLQAEAAQARSEETIRDVFRSIQDIVWAVSLSSHEIIYVSDAAQTLFGATQAQLHDNNYWLSLLDAEGRSTIMTFWWHLLEEGESTCILPLANTEGAMIWLDVRAWLVKNRQGEQERVVGVAADITERQQTLQQLETQVAALEAAASAIVIADHDALIQWVNPAFTKLTGYSADEALGTSLCALELDAQIYADFTDAFWMVAAEQEAYTDTLVSLRKDGTEFLQRQTVTPVVNDQGVLTQFIAIKQDVTEQERARKLSEDYKRISAQFKAEEERNKLYQKLMSALSHDLRQPLTVISTNRFMLSQQSQQLTQQQRLEKLDTIKRQVQYARDLLEDTLHAVRGDLDANRLNLTLVNLDAVCRVCVDEFQATYHTNHRITFINRSKLKAVHVDEILVSRVLLNLLSNAVKYSPEHLPIVLELDQDENYILLRVIDDGIGIPEEEIELIFDPFYRAQSAFIASGSGLGLSIVRDCVELHRGTVSVHSKVGEGTTFTVALPLSIIGPDTPNH